MACRTWKPTLARPPCVRQISSAVIVPSSASSSSRHCSRLCATGCSSAGTPSIGPRNQTSACDIGLLSVEKRLRRGAVHVDPGSLSRRERHQLAPVRRAALVRVRRGKLGVGDLKHGAFDAPIVGGSRRDVRVMRLAARCRGGSIADGHQRWLEAWQRIARAGQQPPERRELHAILLQSAVGKQERHRSDSHPFPIPVLALPSLPRATDRTGRKPRTARITRTQKPFLLPVLRASMGRSLAASHGRHGYTDSNLFLLRVLRAFRGSISCRKASGPHDHTRNLSGSVYSAPSVARSLSQGTRRTGSHALQPFLLPCIPRLPWLDLCRKL